MTLSKRKRIAFVAAQTLLVGLAFGFLLDGSPALNYRGQSIPAGEVIVLSPSSEHEYVSGKETESLIVTVDIELVTALGWKTSTQVTNPCPRAVREALVGQCGQIAEVAERSPQLDRLTELELRDRVIDGVSVALEPWLGNRTGRVDANGTTAGAYHVFRRAVDAVERDERETPSIRLLARHLKVSERTLYRSFKQWAGVGPYEYFQIRKLHAFRRHLLTGRPHRGKVLEAAEAAGFDHLSRLAQRYKRHFGELPSETLAKQGEDR